MALSEKKDSVVHTTLPSTGRTFLKAGGAIAVCTLFVVGLLSVVSLTRGFLISSQKEVIFSGGRFIEKIQSPLQSTPFLDFVTIDSDLELIDKLKEFNIWSIPENAVVPPVVFNYFPEGISLRPTKTRKKIFFNFLIPSALIVQTEIENERRYLNQILLKYRGETEPLFFNQMEKSWQDLLSQDELQFIQFVTRKYRTSDADTLVKRIDTIPVSLVLAQGAIESSWGSSRFVREANNLFGIWTWKRKGVIPEFRDEGKNHKVASYPSLIDSVRAYCLNLNRLDAYSEFRTVRTQTMNPLILAEKLTKYSARGENYVREISDVIRINELQKYDNCSLEISPTL